MLDRARQGGENEYLEWFYGSQERSCAETYDDGSRARNVGSLARISSKQCNSSGQILRTCYASKYVKEEAKLRRNRGVLRQRR